jgi:hypothetical protein
LRISHPTPSIVDGTCYFSTTAFLLEHFLFPTMRRGVKQCFGAFFAVHIVGFFVRACVGAFEWNQSMVILNVRVVKKICDVLERYICLAHPTP